MSLWRDYEAMKNKTKALLTFALLLPVGTRAQQTTPAYDFRVIAEPGTVIGARTFARATSIGRVAINDSGEIAFIASEAGPAPPAVLTSRRVVAKQGDVIDGKIILSIEPDAAIAINNAGQVAYEAFYADAKEIRPSEEPTGHGIFVDNRLEFGVPFGHALPAFRLTGNGWVVIRIPSLKASRGKKRFASSQPFPMNRRGQIAIPVNFPNGFLLLLGTPVRHENAGARALAVGPRAPRFGSEYAR